MKIAHFAKVFQSKPISEPNRPDTPASANVLLTPNTMLSNIHHVTSTDPAPNVSVNISPMAPPLPKPSQTQEQIFQQPAEASLDF